MESVSPERVLVVGAGPSGLAVAGCLRRANVPFDLVDRRGDVGGAYGLIRPDLTLLSLARNVGLPGLRFASPARYPTASAYRQYLQSYAAFHHIQPVAAEVTRVEHRGGGLEVRFAGRPRSEPYAAVVVATGMFDSPSVPDLPGLRDPSGARPELLHSSSWPGPGTYRGRRVLVVGGGTSAVEISENCVAGGVEVVLSARRPMRLIPKHLLGLDVHNLGYHLLRLTPAALLTGFCGGRRSTPPVDRGFRRFHRAGLITVAGPVHGFDGRTALFADGRREFDVVVLATGYRFDYPFLPPELPPVPQGGTIGRPGWPPGLFVVGYRCARTASSEFLRGIAADAPIVAERVAEHLRGRRRQ